MLAFHHTSVEEGVRGAVCISWTAGVVSLLLALAVPGAGVAPAMASVPKCRVVVQFANDVVTLDSAASTVGELLSELSLHLPPDAAPDPPAAAALMDGLTVYLPDVSVVRGATDVALPVSVEVVDSWHYGPEEISARDPGREGLKRISWTVFIYNGREVGRRLREEVLRPMLPQTVVCYRTLTSEDGPSAEQILAMRAKPGAFCEPPRHYKRVVTMESTAYEPGPTSCGGDDSGATASGIKAGYGVAAVDPGVIALGTRLYIDGYGYAVAGDTGGAVKGNVIDLCFMTLDECYAWGRRDVTVYVLY